MSFYSFLFERRGIHCQNLHNLGWYIHWQVVDVLEQLRQRSVLEPQHAFDLVQ
jgi:hypothetical protein